MNASHKIENGIIQRNEPNDEPVAGQKYPERTAEELKALNPLRFYEKFYDAIDKCGCDYELFRVVTRVAEMRPAMIIDRHETINERIHILVWQSDMARVIALTEQLVLADYASKPEAWL